MEVGCQVLCRRGTVHGVKEKCSIVVQNQLSGSLEEEGEEEEQEEEIE